MQQETKAAIESVLSGETLSAESMRLAIGAIMDGRCDDVEIAALLTGLAVRGETQTELAGAASAMRERATRIETTRTGIIDTCGTGGDKLHTFNISTATAFVLAGSAIPVAKHGNRSVSSSSGSATVLETLGVKIGITPEQAGACLDSLGICFCYARTCHSAMKHVANARQSLGFRTIFNLLGPLTNPAGAEFQLLGAPRNHFAEKIAGAARELGTKRTLVVCGNDEIDEVALWGTTAVWDVHDGEITRHEWSASDFGLPEVKVSDLRVSSPEESADVIRGILQGEPGPARDIVLANAAAGLWCCGEAESLRKGVEQAETTIEFGAAKLVLDQLIEWTTFASQD